MHLEAGDYYELPAKYMWIIVCGKDLVVQIIIKNVYEIFARNKFSRI